MRSEVFMWAMGHGAALAAFEPQSQRLIHGYAAHLRSRAQVCERKRDADFERYVPGSFAETPDGTIAMGREDEGWSLWLDWVDGYGRRQLAFGTWEEVERYALEVIVHGPPGGPDLRGQGSQWRDIGGDGTLHSLTLGGEYRLMPLYDAGHVLALSRNDGPVRVLGIGDAESLQRAPGTRRSNDVLHVSIGGERVELRSVCAAGVLGVLDWYGGSRLLLGHLEGESFGLFLLRGSEGRCLRRYDFEAVRRGDLGELLALMSPGRGERSGVDEGEVLVGDAPRTASQRPRHPPHQSAPAKPGRRAQVATPQPRAPKPAPRRAGFSPEERRRIEDYLSVTEPRPATGPGATKVPDVFKGLRAHAARGGPTLLLRNCDLRSLLEGIEPGEAEGVKFHCCTKTFGRAVAAVARHTSLLEPVGKRWLVLGGDQLLEKLNASEAAPEASWAPPAGPVPPAMDPQPAARPASSTTHAEPSASSTTSAPHGPEQPASSAERPEPLASPASSTTPAPQRPEQPASSTARPEPLASQAPASPGLAPGQPPPIEGRPADEADMPDFLIQVPPAGDKEKLPTLEQVLARKYTFQRFHAGNIMRVSRASVPDGVSASRHPGKKPRDGPE
jgi:hypothetical protein